MTNAELQERYPRITDPLLAINFALDEAPSLSGANWFLEAWRDGAWDEIETAYPEFLQKVSE